MKKTLLTSIMVVIFSAMLFTKSFALNNTNQEYDELVVDYIINAKESDFVWKDEVKAKVLVIPGTETWIIPITPKHPSKNVSTGEMETRVVREYKVSYLGETTQPAIRLSNDYIAEYEDLHLNKEIDKSFGYTISGGAEFTISDFKAHGSYSYNENYSEKESVSFTIPKGKIGRIMGIRHSDKYEIRKISYFANPVEKVGYLYDPLYMTIFISLEPYRK